MLERGEGSATGAAPDEESEPERRPGNGAGLLALLGLRIAKRGEQAGDAVRVALQMELIEDIVLAVSGR